MRRILSVVSGLVLLGTAGCATNGYVRSEVDPLADRLAKLEARTSSLENSGLGTSDKAAIQQANDKADRALAATEDLRGQVKGANDKAQDALAQVKRSDEDAKRAEAAADRAEAAQKGAQSAANTSEQAAKKSEKIFAIEQHK